jgi:hypothetical protein
MSRYSHISNHELVEMVLGSEDLSPSARELVGRFEDAIEELENLRGGCIPSTEITGALHVLYDILEEQKHS